MKSMAREAAQRLQGKKYEKSVYGNQEADNSS
jgi:hypothetical protein